MRNNHTALLLFGLFVVFLAGCQVITLPTETPMIPVASTMAVSAAATERAVTQVLSTTIPSATPSSHFDEVQSAQTSCPVGSQDWCIDGQFAPSLTLAPLPTRRPSPTPTATPDLNLQVTWSERVELIDDFFGSQMLWSPTNNEYVFLLCPGDEATTTTFVLLPEEQQVDITPTELICYSVQFLWHPNGDYFLLTGQLSPSELYPTYYEWRIDHNELVPVEFGETSPYWGWFDDELAISHLRVGTGIFYIDLFNVVTGEYVSGTTFAGRVVGVSNKYVILFDDVTGSVAVLAQESISPQYVGWEFGTYVKYLSMRFDGQELTYLEKSGFIDVLPDSDEVLVLTWPRLSEFDPYYDPEMLISGAISANLQLWNVDTDELSLVVSGGMYGGFAPDGSTFLYMTPGETYPTLQLERWNTREPIFQLPVYPKVSLTSFSPDSRYITFFTPAFFTLSAMGQITTLELSVDETYLTVYDQAIGRFLPQTAANPKTPVWSPVSNRFAFWNTANEMLLYDVAANAVYPIAETGGDHLNNPQWSFDGTYLSLNLYPYPCYPDCHFVILEMP